MPCAGDAVYQAAFTPEYIDYTVKFQDADGNVISEQTYHWGDAITVPENPTKPADNTFTYTFAGWDKEIAGTCNGDATYAATYESTYIEYTVIFQLPDGTVLQQTVLHYGDAVVAPEDPAAPEDYWFKGWDSEVTECRGNVTYTAVFKLIHIPGDLDNNEVVNTDDVYRLLLYISLPNRFPLEVDVDYNGDNIVNTDDLYRLLLHISLPDRFPL